MQEGVEKKLAYYGKRDFLIAVRKKTGKSQQLVAALSDISQSSYSQIEQGFYNPPPEVVNRVTKVLGITPEDFYSHDQVRMSRR